MEIIATTDFHFGLRDKAEIITRGTAFTPPGTGTMSAKDQAQSLIRAGSCCLPKDWPEIERKTQAGYDWARAEVARLNAQA